MPSGWAICLLLRTVTSVNCVGKRCLLQAAAQGHFLTLSNCYLSGPQLKPKCGGVGGQLPIALGSAASSLERRYQRGQRDKEDGWTLRGRDH